MPLHLTPPGLHPRNSYPDFLGGNIVFTQRQFDNVNGFPVDFSSFTSVKCSC